MKPQEKANDTPTHSVRDTNDEESLLLNEEEPLQSSHLASHISLPPKSAKAWGVRRSSVIVTTPDVSPINIWSGLLKLDSPKKQASLSPERLTKRREGTVSKHNYLNCAVCGTAFLEIKRSIIPSCCAITGGVFGKGKRAKTAEALAFLVYVGVVSVSIYWVAIYAYLYFNTGWLGNLSTTFATYRSLEAPSVVMCRDPRISKELPWDISATVRLLNAKDEYQATVWLTPCPKIRPTCRCLNTWNIPFQDANHASLAGLPMLYDETQSLQKEADSLHVSFENLSGRQIFEKKAIGTRKNVPRPIKQREKKPQDEDISGAIQITNRDSMPKHMNSKTVTNQDTTAQEDSIGKSAIAKKRKLREAAVSTTEFIHPGAINKTLTNKETQRVRFSFMESQLLQLSGSRRLKSSSKKRLHISELDYKIDEIIWLGVYDSHLIPELGDSLTWIPLRARSEVTIGVSLVRSWIIDPQRLDSKRLVKGEFAHAEHTYMIDVHSVTKAARYLNVTKQMRRKRNLPEPLKVEILDDPLIRLNLRFASFTAIEVWRVGVSMSVALVGLAAISLSAFNKMFIFSTLFPFYDAEYPQKLKLTALAKILCCGYFDSSHGYRRRSTSIFSMRSKLDSKLLF